MLTMEELAKAYLFNDQDAMRRISTAAKESGDIAVIDFIVHLSDLVDKRVAKSAIKPGRYTKGGVHE